MSQFDIPAMAGPVTNVAREGATSGAAGHHPIRNLGKSRTGRVDLLSAAGMRAFADYRAQHAIDLSQFGAIWQRMKEVSPYVMARSLWDLGCLRDGNHVTVESIAARCRSTPKYLSLMSQWLPELADAGLVRRVPGAHEAYVNTLADFGQVQSRIDEALTSVDLATHYPGFIDYFKTCVKHQTALLVGETNPHKLLFPAGSSQIVNGLYRDNPAAAMQNRVAAAIVHAAAAECSDARPMRVLEVGAGTGATTAAILSGLPFTYIQYHFTDISRFFIRRAAREFSQHPYVSYDLLDIDRPPLEQGFEPRSFDIVIAANVLHTAKDIGVTLKYLHGLLSDSGAIVAIETTSNTPLQMITFGHFEGVCHFQDQRRHSNLPFLSCAEWQSALHGAGFGKVATIPSAEGGSKDWMQHVLLGARGRA